jgi:predicted lipid-binding transport protein (Tim44 family)
MITALRTSRLGAALGALLAAMLIGAASGLTISKYAGLNTVVIATLAGACVGALAANYVRMLVARIRRRRHQGTGSPPSDWHIDPEELRFSDEWNTDIGESRIAWAQATLAARDAWERAARQSRKRIALGDPPPRTGEDT